MSDIEIYKSLPDTQKWDKLKQRVSHEWVTKWLIFQALDSSPELFNRFRQDDGLKLTLRLLTEIPLAMKQRNITASLNEIGIKFSKKPNVYDLTRVFNKHLHRSLMEANLSTGFSEMIIASASEVITSVFIVKSEEQFNLKVRDIRKIFAPYSEPQKYSILAKGFFSRILCRYIYHLTYLEHYEYVHPDNSNRFFLSVMNDYYFRLYKCCWDMCKFLDEVAESWHKQCIKQDISEKLITELIDKVFERFGEESRKDQPYD